MSIFFDQTVIASADIGSVSGTSADGLVGGSTPYNGKAWIRRYDGTQTAVDFILNAAFPTQWSSTSIRYDNAYLAIQFLSAAHCVSRRGEVGLFHLVRDPNPSMARKYSKLMASSAPPPERAAGDAVTVTVTFALASTPSATQFKP